MKWERFKRQGERLRVTETSCCGEYEWACQGGLFLVLRHGERGYEEAGRGTYRQARGVWDDLVLAHRHRNAQVAPAIKRRGSRGGSRSLPQISHPKEERTS
ncbi:hypothetical protein ABT294_23875 [Nonomuraea sp. NPDC000554]|uniref:hypothetical protein n=1 Tax=Nonomuraea sp. NPDC000554 TaxID=3154259 RepID=UPI003330999A